MNFFLRGLQTIKNMRVRDGFVIGAGIVCLWVLFSSQMEPRHFPDEYFTKAKIPWWDLKLYITPKPFGLYFFYKFARYDVDWVIALQHIFSVFAWSFLGYVIAKPIKAERWACLTLAIFLLASLHWNLAGWNYCLLSESMTATLLALFYGAFLLFWQNPNRGRLIFLLAISFYFGILRDQVPFLLISCFGLCWVWAFFQRKSQPKLFKYLGVLLLFSVGMFALTSWSAKNANRHVFSFYNVFLKRILPYPERLAWFEQAGMPVEYFANGPIEWENKWASDHDMSLFKNQFYMPMHDWTVAQGKSELAKFFITHPGYVSSLAWQHRHDILSQNLVDYTGPPPERFMFQLALRLWDFWNGFLIFLALVVYGIQIFRKKVSALPLVLGICATLNGLLAFHADAMEIQRHCLLAGWAIQIALWHAVVMMVSRTKIQNPESNRAAISS